MKRSKHLWTSKNSMFENQICPCLTCESELESVRIEKCQVGKCQNRKVSESNFCPFWKKVESVNLENVRITKCQNLKVSESEGIIIRKCQNLKVSEFRPIALSVLGIRTQAIRAKSIRTNSLWSSPHCRKLCRCKC